MKMTRLPCLLIAAGMFVAVFGIQAHATQPSIYRYQGLGAAAYYYAVDESGCVATYVFVEFGETTSGTPPNQIQEPMLAYMYINQWDMCNYSSKSANTNPPVLLPEGAVSIDPSLKAASLNAAIPLIDYSTNTTFTANVSITWTATGLVQRSNRHDHNKTEWGFFDSNIRSLSRDATVSGNIIVDGINLTSSPWAGPAWIEQESQGSISILRKP